MVLTIHGIESYSSRRIWHQLILDSRRNRSPLDLEFALSWFGDEVMICIRYIGNMVRSCNIHQYLRCGVRGICSGDVIIPSIVLSVIIEVLLVVEENFERNHSHRPWTRQVKEDAYSLTRQPRPGPWAVQQLSKLYLVVVSCSYYNWTSTVLKAFSIGL